MCEVLKASELKLWPPTGTPARQAAHFLRMVGNPLERAGKALLLRQSDCNDRLQERMVICALETGQKSLRDTCRTRVLAGEDFGF